MKKNIRFIWILIIIYIIVCIVSYKISHGETYMPLNFMDTSRENEIELIKGITYSQARHEEQPYGEKNVYLKIANRREVIFTSYDDHESDKIYKIIFTNNESYQKDLKDNGIIDYSSIKALEDYETKLPIFDNQRFKKMLNNIVKDSSKANEKVDDLLIVIAYDNKAIEYFYIDGRIVENNDILHRSDEFYYRNYGMALVENDNDTNPKYKLMLFNDIRYTTQVFYDEKTGEAVRKETRYDEKKGQTLSVDEWREKMTIEEFEEAWGDIDMIYNLGDGGVTTEMKK